MSTAKEKIKLMYWCQKAIIAQHFQESAIQIEQLKMLQIEKQNRAKKT